MARIVCDLPPRFGFATEVQVYINHVNQGGHLDNALLLTLVSEARVRFFRALGHSEANVGGLPIVVGDMQAQYRSEAYHGETLRVEMMPLDLSRCAVTGTMDDLIWVSPRTGRAVSREAGAPYADKLLRLPPFMLGAQAGLDDGDVGSGLDACKLCFRSVEMVFQIFGAVGERLRLCVCVASRAAHKQFTRL